MNFLYLVFYISLYSCFMSLDHLQLIVPFYIVYTF